MSLVPTQATTCTKKESDQCRMLGPKTHLALFSWCQIIIYFDRGLIAGMLDFISTEVDDAQSKFVAGLLGGMFMVGYMFFSPLFVRLSQLSREWTLYAIVMGLSILVFSAVGTYFASTSFAALLVLRLFSGAGEAAFCSLAPPIIDSSAPIGKKSLYVGVYFTFLYVGFGLGSAACFAFSSWNAGRLLFLIEAAMVLPCIAVFILLRHRFAVPETIREDIARSSNGGSLMSQLKVVLGRTTFFLLTVGMGGFYFAFGAFAFWVPTVIKNLYPESKSMADLAFGTVTILTGVVGTASGGVLMDYVCRKMAAHKSFRGFKDDTVRVMAGGAISAVLVLLGLVFTLPATFAPNLFAFLIFFAVGTLVMFSITAPVNIAVMYAVPPALKSQAMAVSVGLSHLIGDFPSPFLTGALIDGIGFKFAMAITCIILLVPAVLWGWSAWIAKAEGDETLAQEALMQKPPTNDIETPSSSTI